MLNQDSINRMYQQVPETAAEAELRLQQLPYSGLALVNKILPNEKVIDIGCGHHIFKKYIPNIVGIDPVYNAADYQVDLQNFTTDQKFNVAFCLGSINYGDSEDVADQISKVVNLLTPTARIYWRFNIDAPTAGREFTRFIWTIERNTEFAKKFGFVVNEHAYELVAGVRKKMYTEWVRF